MAVADGLFLPAQRQPSGSKRRHCRWREGQAAGVVLGVAAADKPFLPAQQQKMPLQTAGMVRHGRGRGRAAGGRCAGRCAADGCHTDRAGQGGAATGGCDWLEGQLPMNTDGQYASRGRTGGLQLGRWERPDAVAECESLEGLLSRNWRLLPTGTVRSRERNRCQHCRWVRRMTDSKQTAACWLTGSNGRTVGGCHWLEGVPGICQRQLQAKRDWWLPRLGQVGQTCA